MGGLKVDRDRFSIVDAGGWQQCRFGLFFCRAAALDLDVEGTSNLMSGRAVATAVQESAMTIALIAALARIVYRMRDRRRRSAARAELSSLSERELRDIGLSHAEALPRGARERLEG